MVSGNGQGCSVWYTAVVLPSPPRCPPSMTSPPFPQRQEASISPTTCFAVYGFNQRLAKVTYSFEPRQGVGSGGDSEASRA